MIAALLLLAAEIEASPECTDLDRADQSTLTMCAGEDFRRADAELNATWKRVVAVMRQQDTGLDRSYDKEPGYFATLLASQRAWLNFRDQQCDLESFQARGGSMQPMLLAGCKATFTRERTRQLQALIEN